MKIEQMKGEIVKIGISLTNVAPTYHATAFWLDINGVDTLVTAAHVLWNLKPKNKLRQKVYLWVANEVKIEQAPYEVEIEVHPENNRCINLQDPGIDAARIIPLEDKPFPKATAVFQIDSTILKNGDSVLGVGYIDRVIEVSTMYAMVNDVANTPVGTSMVNITYKLTGGALPACSGGPFFKADLNSKLWTDRGKTISGSVVGTLIGRANQPRPRASDEILVQSILQYVW
ncbi:TPA: hypothetical protein NGS29_004666 [Vibrio parahaemolyticus]|nr:hypothetical protein [Vibrio parahaemolyticus]